MTELLNIDSSDSILHQLPLLMPKIDQHNNLTEKPSEDQFRAGEGMNKTFTN